jgi:hypothetical protein
LNRALINGAHAAHKRGGVMEKHKEHALFAGIVMLVIGGVALQMMGAGAVTLPSDPPAVVKTIVPLALIQNADGSRTETTDSAI